MPETRDEREKERKKKKQVVVSGVDRIDWIGLDRNHRQSDLVAAWVYFDGCQTGNRWEQD